MLIVTIYFIIEYILQIWFSIQVGVSLYYTGEIAEILQTSGATNSTWWCCHWNLGLSSLKAHRFFVVILVFDSANLPIF